jgi:hypothetical protein
MISESGPYLAAALICEKILQEIDGVISIIRNVDRITLTVPASTSPAQMPPTPINLYTFISLKSGSAKGRYTIKLVPEAPSGIKLPEQLLPVLFEGDDRGANLILALNMLIDQEGIYISFIFTFTHFTSDAPLSSVYYDSKGQKLYPMV